MSAWEGERVRLRAFESSDVDALMTADADTDTARLGWRVFPPRPVEAFEPKPHDGDDFRLAIESLASKELVGAITTHRCDPVHGTCMYGITVFPWAHRQGYGREAVVLVLRYLFGERRYQKCTVGVFGFNDASVAFHEALGFQHEGRLRRMWFAMGEHHDEVVMGITVEEFVRRWGMSGPVG